jgi:hypothetical protein
MCHRGRHQQTAVSQAKMIKQLKFLQSYDVVPQAIFWRPLVYFTTRIFVGEDGLDQFQGASFCIGNSINFDLC